MDDSVWSFLFSYFELDFLCPSPRGRHRCFSIDCFLIGRFYCYYSDQSMVNGQLIHVHRRNIQNCSENLMPVRWMASIRFDYFPNSWFNGNRTLWKFVYKLACVHGAAECEMRVLACGVTRGGKLTAFSFHRKEIKWQTRNIGFVFMCVKNGFYSHALACALLFAKVLCAHWIIHYLFCIKSLTYHMHLLFLNTMNDGAVSRSLSCWIKKCYCFHATMARFRIVNRHEKKQGNYYYSICPTMANMKYMTEYDELSTWEE